MVSSFNTSFSLCIGTSLAIVTFILHLISSLVAVASGGSFSQVSVGTSIISLLVNVVSGESFSQGIIEISIMSWTSRTAWQYTHWLLLLNTLITQCLWTWVLQHGTHMIFIDGESWQQKPFPCCPRLVPLWANYNRKVFAAITNQPIPFYHYKMTNISCCVKLLYIIETCKMEQLHYLQTSNHSAVKSIPLLNKVTLIQSPLL